MLVFVIIVLGLFVYSVSTGTYGHNFGTYLVWGSTLGIFVVATVDALKSALEKIKRQHRMRVEIRNDRNEQKRREQQVRTNLLDEISACHARSMSLLASIPAAFQDIENLIVEANTDFTERAYYPFWDTLEKAAIKAADVNQTISALNWNAHDYRKKVDAYKGSVPDFPVTSAITPHLTESFSTVKRIEAIARIAHRDFQFSTIYATRKTNNILIAGFKGLNEALNGISLSLTEVGDRLDNGLRQLEMSTLSAADGISTAINTMRQSHEDSAQARALQGKAVSKMNTESAERERTIIAMLDNIQRNRAPLPFTTH